MVESSVSRGDSLDATRSEIQVEEHLPSEDLESCPGEEPATVFPTTAPVLLYGAPCRE